MDLTSVVALMSVLAMLLFYRPHPNDGQLTHPTASLRAVPARDLMMVTQAGIMWALANGAFAIMLGFAPNLLQAEGLSLSQTGMLLALLSWLMVGSIQFGAALEDRWPRPNLMVLAGYAVPTAAMLLLPTAPPLLPVLAFGLLGGFPIGVMLALPAQVLHPQHRSVGMGVFYSLMYLGMTALPPAAGWLGDRMASPAAPIYFGGLLYLAVLPLFLLFRATQVGSPKPVGAPAVSIRRT
jgi:MFS family permease